MIFENLGLKYQHQLYFLTDESKKIRQFFQNLVEVDISNNNINNVHFSEKIYNIDELAQKIAVLTKNSKFYKNIISMIETDEAIKIIFAFLFKGFGWRNDIYDNYNISSNLYVQNTISTLHKLNLLSKQKGIELNNIFFEALQSTKNTDIKQSVHQADIYFINEDFIEFCNLLTDFLKYQIGNNSSLRISIRSIIHDCNYFEMNLDRIMREEVTLHRRKHYKNGIYYETETLRSKNLKKNITQVLGELKVEKLEQKQQQNCISQQEIGQLAIYNKTNNYLDLFPEKQAEDIDFFKKNKVATKTYNGKKINDQEFSEILVQNKKIDNSPAIIGNPELALQRTIFDRGLFLSKEEISEWVEATRPKTEDEKVEELFANLILR